MECLTTIVNSFKPLTITAKFSILDRCGGPGSIITTIQMPSLISYFLLYSQFQKANTLKFLSKADTFAEWLMELVQS